MPRIAADKAHSLRAEVHALAARGMGVREIMRAMGFKSPSSVQNYLASAPDAVSPAVVREAVVALKSAPEHRHRGAMELRSMVLASHGAAPSETVAERLFSAAGLTTAHRSGTDKLPYHVEVKPAAYLDQVQLDTVKLRTVDGVLVELLTARDVFTGVTLLQLHDASQVGMCKSIARLFAVLGGVPRVVQCDNGTTDFSLARRHLLRPWHKMAFARGVERIQFIPEAEPKRNGSVESFHDWLQDEFSAHGRAQGVTADTLEEWLLGRLYYYNYNKPLSSLGGKGGRLAPAAFAPSFDLDAFAGEVDYSYPERVTRGCVSFIRRVIGAREGKALCPVAVVKAPSMVFLAPDALEGRYLRFDLHIGGLGVILSPRPVQFGSGELTERKHRGRYAGRVAPGVVVGTFNHDLEGVLTDGVIDPVYDEMAIEGYTPVRTDVALIIRRWRKVLKQRVPQLLPEGYTLALGLDGEWECWRGDDLLWTEQASPEVLEHAREIE